MPGVNQHLPKTFLKGLKIFSGHEHSDAAQEVTAQDAHIPVRVQVRVSATPLPVPLPGTGLGRAADVTLSAWIPAIHWEALDGVLGSGLMPAFEE